MYKVKLLYPSIELGQRLLYRLGSALGLVLVLRCNAIAHTVLHVSQKFKFSNKNLSNAVSAANIFMMVAGLIPIV